MVPSMFLLLCCHVVVSMVQLPCMTQKKTSGAELISQGNVSFFWFAIPTRLGTQLHAARHSIFSKKFGPRYSFKEIHICCIKFGYDRI